jgi:uncharacterized protein (TIGR03437 family)
VALAPTPAQQSELDRLLEQQQTPGSPNYHRWLSPEEYAARFGVSDADLAQISDWLTAQGLTVVSTARGRNWIAVSGDAARLEAAFQTEIHEFAIDGEAHVANVTPPSVPAAFAGAVRGIRGLNDFRMKPAARAMQRSQPDDTRFTSGRINHYLAPGDLAVIYNIRPLYDQGIDGSGQSLVVVGQTQVDLTDPQLFRSTYGLPPNDPEVIRVPGTRDPGISKSDLPEANLDLEWSAAIARKAHIIYVYAYDVSDAIQYSIDQNLAPVISTSYGLCEPETGLADALILRSWAKQAAAQGITWIAPSGDTGGADCGDSQNPGFAVDLPASIPEVTGIGGTMFDEGGAPYWNSANDATGTSALSYIPEVAWNDSAAAGQPSATGGGASSFFLKPPWQVMAGVPADNARHVPDISFAASAEHDGYLVTTGGKTAVYGGTSVPAPVFGGIAALANQYLVMNGSQPSPGLGNLNPRLYALARLNPDIFHDISSGDNLVTIPCASRTVNCGSAKVGYLAGKAYDQATGLGSVDVLKLVTSLATVQNIPDTAIVGRYPKASVALLSNLNSLAPADTAVLIATVTGADGATPSGTVEFTAANTALGSAPLSGLAGVATATINLSGAALPAGTQIITATSRDSGSYGMMASVALTFTAGGPANFQPKIAGVVQGASFTPAASPGALASMFGSSLASSSELASAVPLPLNVQGLTVTVNGVAAPVLYASSGQINFQIPYETALGPATVAVNNNGQTTTGSVLVQPAAPGIFTDPSGQLVPASTARAGQIATLFWTGAGAVNPAVATGAAPAFDTPVENLPRPAQDVVVTVGGIPAELIFVGTPQGLVGVVQINFVVPSGLSGAQPVKVSAGSVSGNPATLVVQ